MNIFFTSDTHFGHENILKYTKRGEKFSTAKEMDEFLIQEWNKKVKPEDCIYHLGDFYLGKPQGSKRILERLNGRIHLIKGNHDRFLIAENSKFFESIQDYLILRKPHKIVLFHYPILDWDCKYQGSYHFFGHSHGTVQTLNRSFDVGIDNHPENSIWELSELIKILENREPRG